MTSLEDVGAELKEIVDSSPAVIRIRQLENERQQLENERQQLKAELWRANLMIARLGTCIERIRAIRQEMAAVIEAVDQIEID